MADDDRGAPIAYMVLEQGTPVQASDGTEVGTVKRVLADTGADLFDGIVIQTGNGERFVDAPEVGDLYERLVVLTIDAEQAARLPEHTAAPAVVPLDADTIAGGDPRGAKGPPRKVWDRLNGKYCAPSVEKPTLRVGKSTLGAPGGRLVAAARLAELLEGVVELVLVDLGVARRRGDLVRGLLGAGDAAGGGDVVLGLVLGHTPWPPPEARRPCGPQAVSSSEIGSPSSALSARSTEAEMHVNVGVSRLV